MGVTYIFEVDWTNTGTWVDITDYVLRAEVRYGKTGTEDRYLVGTAYLTLNNADGRFHNRNTASPYYPNILPGRPVRIRAYDGTTYYDVFNGFLVEIDPIGAEGQRVKMECHDALGFYKNSLAEIGLLENKRTDEVVTAYLDDIGVSLANRDIDTGQTVIQYAYASRKFGEAMRAVAEAEQGRIYVTREGKIRFESRHWRLQPAQQTVSWTITASDIQDAVAPLGWETVKNRITVTAHPVEIKSTAVLWKSQTVVEIPAGGNRDVWASFTDPDTEQLCAGKSVITPVATTDYTANSAPDGSGTDLTLQVSISMSAFSDKAKLTITNSASVNAYMTLLQVRGQPVVTRDISVRQEDSSSIASYGRRDMNISPAFLQDVDTAENMARFVLAMTKTPAGAIQIEMLIDNILPEALMSEISDRISVTDPYHYLSGDEFYIEGFVYDLVPGGNSRVTVYAKPADTTGGWFVVGYARAGETTRLAY